MREAFEAWFQAPVPLKQDADGNYVYQAAYNAWTAFQAGWNAREQEK